MGELSTKQRYWMIKRHLCGVKVAWLCEKLDINRDTFYYHWNNFQREGWDGLKPKSKVPHTIHRIPQEIVDKVISIRKERGWGPNKIERYLRGKDIRSVIQRYIT